MDEFVNTDDEDDLSTFLSEVALVADVDSMDDSSEALTLMTMHSAKGLEYPLVYATGVEDELFPFFYYKKYDETQLEEERRLFYVAITRAEKRLHISYALNRIRNGSYSGGKSMFIDEIPDEYITLDKRKPAQKWGSLKKNQPIRKTMEFEDYSQDVPDFEDESPFKVGSFVRSPSFGLGKVVACSGNGEDLMLTIEFGRKKMKIMAQYGKLVPA
ncbi:ATP-dependent DNA helicase UvrD1 [subsurface metagenome]